MRSVRKFPYSPPPVPHFSRQGYPNIRTVDYWLGGDQSERYPQSRYAYMRTVGVSVHNLRTD